MPAAISYSQLISSIQSDTTSHVFATHSYINSRGSNSCKSCISFLDDKSKMGKVKKMVTKFEKIIEKNEKIVKNDEKILITDKKMLMKAKMTLMKNKKMVGETEEKVVSDETNDNSIEKHICSPKSTKTKHHKHRAADIPEWCPDRDRTKYDAAPEKSVQIWTPITDNEEKSMPEFLCVAKSMLAVAQIRQGIPENEAVENSCNGLAEQYILDTLHDSGYSREIAVRALMTKDIPSKIHERWRPIDVILFEKGLSEQKKKFSTISGRLLNHKTTMDIVEHYYEWKRSGKVKGVGESRARVLLRRQDSSGTVIIGNATDPGITTRSKNPKNGQTDASPRVTVLRKNVYMSIKRKRKSAKSTH